MPSPSGLTHTFQHHKEYPRWQQGWQPAQLLDVTTHQPGNHYSQAEKPQSRSLTPHAASPAAPKHQGRGPQDGRAVSGSSIQRQTGRNEGESQTADRLEQGHDGARASLALPGPQGGPQPWEGPPALTWQEGKASWCCSSWPMAKFRTLANLAWCCRNWVRSSESSSSCGCARHIVRKWATTGARCYHHSSPRCRGSTDVTWVSNYGTDSVIRTNKGTGRKGDAGSSVYQETATSSAASPRLELWR